MSNIFNSVWTALYVFIIGSFHFFFFQIHRKLHIANLATSGFQHYPQTVYCAVSITINGNIILSHTDFYEKDIGKERLLIKIYIDPF